MTDDERSAFELRTNELAGQFLGGFELLIDAGNRNRELIGRLADPGDGDEELMFGEA